MMQDQVIKKQRESQQAIEGETQKCPLELRTKELRERKRKRERGELVLPFHFLSGVRRTLSKRFSF